MNQVGHHHFALQLEHIEALKEGYRTLQRHGVPIVRAVDHGITKSLYFCDPAGNRIELYCDVGDNGIARLRQQSEQSIMDFPPLNLEA